MASLTTFLVLLVMFFYFAAAVPAWAARAVGSKRASLLIGLLATLMLMALAVLTLGIIDLLPQQSDFTEAVAGLGMLITQWFVALVLYRSLFKLSWGRAFAPLGAYAGVSIGYALLSVFVLHPFIMNSYRISSRSMEYSFKPGDRIFFSRLLTPRRWDIVAYHNNDHRGSIFCKRILGLPGERIRIENNTLYINDHLQRVPEAVVGHLLGSPLMERFVHEGKTFTLGQTEYFVIGDNLSNSADSRINGPTDRSKIVGVGDCRYWPIYRFSILR